jgi:hypothetical protein
MRVPQVSERIKEAPAQALRGVFAGIGQLLLYTDKLRNKTPASQQVPRARAPEPTEHVTPAAAARVEPPAPSASASTANAASTAAAPPAADRDFDKTGNVRLLTGTEAAAGDTAPAAEAAAPPAADASAPPAAEAAAPPAADASAAPVADLPLANYDELSVASLRARLRNLDVPQLRELAGYERAHAGRADVITMFERRIAKLEAETSADEA